MYFENFETMNYMFLSFFANNNCIRLCLSSQIDPYLRIYNDSISLIYRKLFVGGLSWETTESEQLIQYNCFCFLFSFAQYFNV